MSSPNDAYDGYSAPRTVRNGLDPDLVRDVAAAALMLLGGAGLVVVAFAQDPLLGAAVVCALLIAAGVLLGYRR